MDIMLDLETLSSQPDAAIVAIGACTFRADGTITPDESARRRFYLIVDAASAQQNGGHISASTVAWWMKQSDRARSIFGEHEARHINIAISEFANFCQEFGRDVRVWGNGASFDNVVLRGAYERIGGRAPWAFFNERCYRTLKNLRPDVLMNRSGVHHNALDDAISQAQHAERIFAAMRTQKEIAKCA